MVVDGQAHEEDTTTHRGVLVWKDGSAIRHLELRRRILFHEKRVHLDVFVGKDKLESELHRLTAAGATLLHWGRQGPSRWVTILDPEGSELCLT
jgi:hypothetical protein